MDDDFLKRKRQECNKTQEEIAKNLGMGKASYQKIEKGINNLHPRHWKKIQQLLVVTEDELVQFTAFVAVSRRRKKIASGEIKPDIVDQTIMANEFAENLRERISFIKRLTEDEYVELVNAYDSGRLDLFQIARVDDIEDFRGRAILGISKMDIPADAKGKVVGFLSNLEQMDGKK